MTQIDIAGNRLTIGADHRVVDFSYPIKEAFEQGGTIVVFLDPDANLGKDGQYRNLIGLDLIGNKKWLAELPTSDSCDVYWRIKQRDPLIVSSFSSYECRINLRTGDIESSEFYK
jgi:hypothetical protein